MLVEGNEVVQQGHVGWEDMTPPPEHVSVTDAEVAFSNEDAEQLQRIADGDYHHPDLSRFPQPNEYLRAYAAWVCRLLADRARDQERIRELEGRLGPRSRAIHNRFAETEEHSGWWEACQVPPCRDDRTLLGEAQDE